MRGYFGIGAEGISKAMNLGNLMRTAHAFGASFTFTIEAETRARIVRHADTSASEGQVPHYPFDRTDRYGATRISLWPGGDVILLLQNLHLMHHLWPGVPFYNYRRLFVALRPLLVAEGSRIEGLGVGPWARRIELAEPAPRKAA